VIFEEGGGGGGGTPGGGGGGGGGMTLQHSGAAQVAPVHVMLDAFVFCFIPAGHVYVKQTGLGLQHSVDPQVELAQIVDGGFGWNCGPHCMVLHVGLAEQQSSVVHV